MKVHQFLAPLCALAFSVPVLAQPPGIPPELQLYIPRNVGPYFVGFLVSAEHPRPMSRELFIRHQDYMRGRFEAGVYRLAGPFTDGGRIHGMVILSAASLEEARIIVGGDPAVQAGAMAVEVHPAMFPDMSSLRVEYPPRP